MQNWQVLGVPYRLARDGWWLSLDSPTPGLGPKAMTAAPRAALGLIGLIALGDWLFWDQAGPGLSLAVFVLAIAGVLRGGVLGPVRPGDVIMLLAVLPLIERVQALSVGFALLGIIGFAIDHSASVPLTRVLSAMPGVILRVLPQQILRAIPQAWRNLRMEVAQVSQRGGSMAAVGRAIALPLGLGLCFGALLILANPVLANIAAALFQLNIDPLRMIARAVFWAGLAIGIWPLLTLGHHDSSMPQTALPRFAPLQLGGLVNAGAVASSLWLFNAMFAVQTGLDAAFLWGGADLPVGSSHAEYAQRGAYPLVATALLAGVFALVSRPYAAQSLIVRGLLLAWVAQNVALVISALARLDSYVAAYGLTYLRTYAAIWMAMVAVGLMLIAWQVLRALPNGWLMLRSAVLALAVLYTCCFVNFAEGIAGYNLSAWRAGSLAYGLDWTYLCNLGPDAWAKTSPFYESQQCRAFVQNGWEGQGNVLDLAQPHIEGWRDWSFRSWRVLRGA